MPIEARREQVLDAALHLIVTRGYGSISMEAIAREANLSKPVVYNAYPRVGELLLALLEREEARAFGALVAALPVQAADGDREAMLMHWIRSLATAIAANPDTWRVTLIQPEETPEVVRAHARAGRLFALEQVRSLIGALPDGQGPLRQLDVDLAAEALLAVAEHCARLLLRDPVSYTPDRLVNFAGQMMNAFLRSPEQLDPNGIG